MKEEDIEFILNSYKNRKPHIKEDIKNELSEEEAIQIYNELIYVLGKHNISYKCALDISISLMYALMTGAAELYDNEMNP
jgi:hypothetical protein